MPAKRFIRGIICALAAGAGLPFTHALLAPLLGAQGALLAAACLGVSLYAAFLSLSCGASVFAALALMSLPLAGALLGAPPAVVALQTGFCLGWIRFVRCFRGSPLSRFLVEVLLVGGGGVLAGLLAPSDMAPLPFSRSALGWSMSLWLFLLVQGVYLLPRGRCHDPKSRSSEEAFELAMRRARQLLDE